MAHSASSRRVLVIAYYFPPMGLSGVQRVSKFVKYLPDHGWEPTVLTVQPRGYFAFDPGLQDELERRGIEVVRTASLDPTRLFGRSRTIGLPAEGVRSTLSFLSQLIFLPDNKIGWYYPAVRAGSRMLRRQSFSAIISSAPPYSGHLVAGALKTRSGLPLLLDFRDDWVGNPRHVYPTALHRRLHALLERRALKRADAVSAINRHIAQALADRHPFLKREGGVEVIPQGFDPEDFSAHVQERRPERLTLLYTGVFYDAQTPETLLRAVARLQRKRPELVNRLQLEFVGLLPDWTLKRAEQLGIRHLVSHEGYLPHAETVERISRADALWMIIGRRPGAEGISTGKLFEYFGSRKPILALVPDGEAKRALMEYGAAFIADPDDDEAVGVQLAQLHDTWASGRLPSVADSFVQQFNRQRLAGKLADRLDQLVEAHETRTS